MADLTADTTRPGYSELNVTTPGGLRVGSAYDLALYPELGSNTRGVLVVTMRVQLVFNDGKADDGTDLAWTDTDKKTYASDFTSCIKDVWNNKHRITTTSTLPADVYKDIGVQFDIKTQVGGWSLTKHWKMQVDKIDKAWAQNSTDTSNTWIWGRGQLNSESVHAVTKNTQATMKQRPATHEFGHQLGHNDEYPQAADHCANWVGDFDSVMHSGEKVRERHYALFAQWITDQFAVAARLGGIPTNFKVNGNTDLSNANL
jgi:hypothetical protein